VSKSAQTFAGMGPLTDSERDFATTEQIQAGLLAVVRRHPGLSQATMGRWVGLKLRTFYGYVQGRAPDLTQHSRVLDLVFGRVEPRQLDDGSWVFERVGSENIRASRLRLIDRMMEAVRAFEREVEDAIHQESECMPLPYTAENHLTGTGPGGTFPEERSEEPVLDYDHRYSSETAEQTKAHLYPSQRRKLKELSQRTGLSQGKLLRAGLERLLDKEAHPEE